MESFSNIKKIKVALIGCGRISKNHIKALLSLKEKVEIIALCDVKEQNIKKALLEISDTYKSIKKSPPKLKSFSSYDQLLEEIKSSAITIDLIVLSTPSGLHASQTVSAAKLGLNVCTEKPMATNWEDGIEMLKATEKAKVKLFVVKQNRFNNTIKLVKEQIDQGRFGKIHLITSNVFWQRPQKYYDNDDWRGTWQYDGGALMNQASHYVDLLCWLGGPVESVSAAIATLGRNIEVEDTAALNLRYRNKALGSMAVTMLTYPKNLEGSITIIGEKGTVKIGGNALNNIDVWEFESDDLDKEKAKDSSYKIKDVYGFGHGEFYKDIINCLNTGNSSVCDGREGIKSLEVICAAYKSAKDASKIVNLPLTNTSFLDN